MKGETAVDLKSVQYQGALTPLLTDISPRYGTVVGGDDVKFTGTNFVTDISKYEIIIDGIVCPVSAATTTQITCKTGKRPFLPATSLTMMIKDRGLVSTQGLVY